MSKYMIPMLLTVTSVIFNFSNVAFGFGNKATHPALTDISIEGSGVDDYVKNQLGMANGIQTQLKYQPEWYQMYIEYRLQRGGYSSGGNDRTALEWMKAGSVIEDEDLDVLALLPSIRPRHHFHDPIDNVGLDNKFDHPDYANLFAWATHLYPGRFDVTGQSAIVWAVKGTAPGKKPTINNQSWDYARDTFYSALTDPESLWREYWLAMTFLELGSVLHMIEDMGVPAHTRNDFIFGHLQLEWPAKIGNPFEGWVEKTVEQNGGQSPWSGSSPVAFDKLVKYFDADVYSGSYLGSGVLPPDTWGLSECTNYQFLSFSTVFGCTGTKYQFPQPTRENVEPNLIVPTTLGNKVYFNGSNYGVTHLVRDSYTRRRAHFLGYTSYPVIDSTITTDDEQVFIDYADITIPRTIDYATGLLNYFFRGRVSVEPNWADPNIVELVITNDSNNSGVPQVLKGGVFELYWNDSDSNRAEVPVYTIFESNIPGETSEWDEDSILEHGHTIRAEFNQPEAEGIRGYTLVYQGSISEEPFEPDPCDPNAIAVTVFHPGYSLIAWGYDNHGQVSNVPDGNEFIAVAAGKWHCLAISSDGSLVGWGYNEHDECNVPAGNDYVDISAGQRHSTALKSDGSIIVWGSDNLNQITDKPDGNDFTAITAGDWHSLAIKSDGTIVGWGGWNSYEECNAPMPDAGTVYIDIAAGTYHSLALQSDGVVKAWGNNNNGQTTIYGGAA